MLWCSTSSGSGLQVLPEVIGESGASLRSDSVSDEDGDIVDSADENGLMVSVCPAGRESGQGKVKDAEIVG